MKILVTGTTGFIGNYVIRQLLHYGLEVVATSRSSEKTKSCEWFSSVHYVLSDINTPNDNHYKLFDKPDKSMAIINGWCRSCC